MHCLRGIPSPPGHAAGHRGADEQESLPPRRLSGTGALRWPKSQRKMTSGKHR